MRIFQRFTRKAKSRRRSTPTCSSPAGLHFWTSSIGKDERCFRVLHGDMGHDRFTRRYLAISPRSGSWCCSGSHRPVAIVAVSLTISSTANRRGSKVLLLLCAVVGSVAMVSTVSTTFNLDINNADSVVSIVRARDDTQRAQEV